MTLTLGAVAVLWQLRVRLDLNQSQSQVLAVGRRGARSPLASICGGIEPRSSNELMTTYSATATIASMMTGTFNGEGPCPGAERACRPASPQISMIRSLKPFTTFAFSWNSGALWT